MDSPPVPRAYLVVVVALGVGVAACGGAGANEHAAPRAVVVAPEPLPAPSLSVPALAAGRFPNPLLPPPTSSTTTVAPVERESRAGLSVIQVGGLSASGEPETLPAEPEVWESRPALDDDRIFLLGDSVLAAAGPDYAGTALVALETLGWQVEMDAKESRPASVGADVIDAHRDDIGDVVVILLGNNYDGDAAAFDADVGEMIAALDGVPWIVFLTVQEFRKNRREVNDVLARWAETGRVTVVDWNAVVTSAKSVNGGDGLHLNRVGAQLLADFVAGTVGPSPSRLAPRPDGAL